MAAKMEKTKTPGIFKRGSRYVVTFRDAAGGQRRESARTLDDARRLKAARTTAVATGEYQERSREHVARLCAGVGEALPGPRAPWVPGEHPR